MASVMTNKGKYRLLGFPFMGGTIPTAYYVMLITDATEPVNITNTVADVTEIQGGATASGYTGGGESMTPNTSDFDSHTEDDTNHWAYVQLDDVVWTATGDLPSTGDGASFAILTDDNVTVASREIYGSWDLGSARSITNTQTLTLIDCEIRLT